MLVGPPYVYDEGSNAVINPYVFIYQSTLTHSHFVSPYSLGEALGFFPYSAAIIALIKAFPDTKIGIASRTTTPDW